MVSLKLLFLVITLIFLIPLAQAKEIKTITLPGGFIESADKIEKTILFPAPPDGISEVYYAKVSVKGDVDISKLYLYVNDKPCIPGYYDIKEKKLGYTAEFDCTNVINKSGGYVLTISADKKIYNIFIEWQITYLNDPKFPKLSFLGTEYYPNADGKIFLQYLDMYGNPINNALCVLDIFKPNNEEYMKGIIMDYIPSSNGLYSYDLTVPNEEGVYPLSAFCVSPASYTKYVANNFTITQGSQTGGDFTYTHELDGLTHDVQAPSTYSYIFQYSFENVSKVSVDLYDKSVNNTLAELWFYNCSLGDYSRFYYMSMLSGRWYHYSKELKGIEAICNNKIEIQIRNPYTSNLQTDAIYVRLWNVTEEQMIRGGGEMHVSNIAKFIDMQEETLIYNHDYCIDNTTLRKEKLVQKCVDTYCWNVTKYEDIVCNYGCQNNECKQPSWIVYGIVLLIIIALIILYMIFR